MNNVKSFELKTNSLCFKSSQFLYWKFRKLLKTQKLVIFLWSQGPPPLTLVHISWFIYSFYEKSYFFLNGSGGFNPPPSLSMVRLLEKMVSSLSFTIVSSIRSKQLPFSALSISKLGFFICPLSFVWAIVSHPLP